MGHRFGCAILLVTLQIIFVCAKPPDFITDDMMAMIKNDKERCMKEHGTTEDLIDQVNKGIFENNRAITCYAVCLFQAFSIIDEDENIEADILIGFLPEQMQAKANEVFEACGDRRGADLCDSVYEIGACAVKIAPELFHMMGNDGSLGSNFIPNQLMWFVIRVDMGNLLFRELVLDLGKYMVHGMMQQITLTQARKDCALHRCTTKHLHSKHKCACKGKK